VHRPHDLRAGGRPRAPALTPGQTGERRAYLFSLVVSGPIKLRTSDGWQKIAHVVEPLGDVRDISRIAYGFMASKILFSALDLDIFSLLAARSKTVSELAVDTGLEPHRLAIFLTACVSLGLLVKRGDVYVNAPASQTYLVRDAPRYFGDYYRFQIDRQIYPAFGRLADALHGERAEFYRLLDNPEEAWSFSRGQHAGSLGPAAVLASIVDLRDRRRLLDVGGGSGAFSITLCRRFPTLSATILDSPSVQPVFEAFVREADMAERIRFLSGDALVVEWPGDQDAILLSYLLSAVAARSIDQLIARAFSALCAGGMVMLHDFMVDDDGRGPTTAALWQVNALLIDPDVAQLSAGFLARRLRAHGFHDARDAEVIPGITRVVTAMKPLPAEAQHINQSP
jgi:ubiquinone/menaquinone biosynthesis C-methylase UbiE